METGLFPLKPVRLYGLEGFVLEGMIDPKIAIATILMAALILFIWGRWRHDVVALAALLAAILVGVVPIDKAFSGFADPAVVTVGLVLILSAAIRQSGVLERTMRAFGLDRLNVVVQLVVLVGLVTVLSAFMNNVGALAIMLPLAIAVAERSQTSPSIFLMPLAFGSLLGGLITLIGTPPNLLVSGVRKELMGQHFAMFDFAPVGLAIAIAGICYLAVAWRLMPADRRGAPSPEQKFKISDFVTEASVAPQSSYIGKTVEELEKVGEGEVRVLALSAGGRTYSAPPRSWTLAEGDVLVLEADSAELKRVVDEAGLALVGDKELAAEHLKSNEFGTIEAVVTKMSGLIGQSSQSMKLRDMGINLLAMSRQNRRTTKRLSRERFREGDVLALQGDLDHLAFMVRELGLLPLSERKIELGRRTSALLPVGVMAAAVAAATAGVLPIAAAFLAGVVVLAVARFMRPDEMYAAVDPSIIVLMAALIPVTEAVRTSGGTDDIAALIARLAAGLSPLMVLAGVLVATLLVTPVLNNAATVLLMAPIAAGYASKAGLNPDAFLMAVAIGASCDFLTPFGHQSNTLVMGPGGYKFLDYARLGLPLTLIIIAVTLLTLPWFWPLSR